MTFPRKKAVGLSLSFQASIYLSLFVYKYKDGFSFARLKRAVLRSSSRQLPNFPCTIEEMEDRKEEQTTKLQNSDLARINWNLMERNRRNHVKDLFSKLYSLVPTNQNSKLSITKLLEQATTYTKQLQEKIEKLRERKELLKSDEDHQKFEPLINIKYSLESTDVEVNIISELKKNFWLHQVISVLEEEGAEVAFSSRIGIETSMVDERMKKLISQVIL